MIRLTGGVHRGRNLKVPAGQKTRPTQARVRQAWLNSIQFFVPDAKVLDLFSGSGALGFEALSRGAESVIFVESQREAIQCLKINAAELGVESQIQIFQQDVWSWLKTPPSFSFDLIFADPPYSKGYEERLLLQCPWRQLLAPSGRFCLEWSPQKGAQTELPQSAGGLVKLREKSYGETVLSTYAFPEAQEGGPEMPKSEEENA